MPGQDSLSRPVNAPKQLLVEGRTAEILFRELAEHLSLTDMQVRDYGDINNLTDYLRTFSRLPGFVEKVRSLGVIRDAEDKPASAAFESVCSSLGVANLPIPSQLGTISGELFRTGVFILPNCVDRGMLEDVCLESVGNEAENKIKLRCVDGFFECIEKQNLALPKNLTKARTWVFLSSQDVSDPQVGRAAQKRIWLWDNVAFKPIKIFLEEL
jgi:hypothetical protein